jgi:hypothetical protein
VAVSLVENVVVCTPTKLPAWSANSMTQQALQTNLSLRSYTLDANPGSTFLFRHGYRLAHSRALGPHGRAGEFKKTASPVRRRSQCGPRVSTHEK